MFSRNHFPTPYDVIEQERTKIALNHHYGKTMIDLGIVYPDRLFDAASQADENYTGRGTIKILTIPGNGEERMVMRQYRRGGPVQKFIRDIYWGSSRPFRELWLTHQANEKGIPTAEIVAACHTKVFWGLHRGHLISREIKNGRDLNSYLESLQQPFTRDTIAEKRNVIAAVAKLIRKMHDAGIFHADLNLKNVVIQIDDKAKVRVFLIDFDKSVIKSHLSERKRRQNLMRLNRSVEKFKRQGLPVTRTDALRFLRAYYEGDGEAVLKGRLRDLNRQYIRHIYFHQLGAKMLGFLAL